MTSSFSISKTIWHLQSVAGNCLDVVDSTHGVDKSANVSLVRGFLGELILESDALNDSTIVKTMHIYSS